jgi:hypothetical protein
MGRSWVYLHDERLRMRDYAGSLTAQRVQTHHGRQARRCDGEVFRHAEPGRTVLDSEERASQRHRHVALRAASARRENRRGWDRGADPSNDSDNGSGRKTRGLER